MNPVNDFNRIDELAKISSSIPVTASVTQAEATDSIRLCALPHRRCVQVDDEIEFSVNQIKMAKFSAIECVDMQIKIENLIHSL